MEPQVRGEVVSDADDGRSRSTSTVAGRFQQLAKSDLFWPVQWRRRILFWGGAVLVGLAAIGFARAADWAFNIFHGVVTHNRCWAFLITSARFARLAWLTEGALKPTRASGIPQAIAALKIEDEGLRRSLLSLRVAIGKMALTLAALLGG